jgi:hypothetical protein
MTRLFGVVQGCSASELIHVAEAALAHAHATHTPSKFECGVLTSESTILDDLIELQHFLTKHTGFGQGGRVDAAGVRRTCPREELNKMWSLHQAGCRAQRVLELCGAKILEVVARLASGDTKVRVGSKNAHCIVSAHTALLLMRLSAVVLGLAWQQYTSSDPSFVLATHLDVTIGAVLGLIERGHWRQGVQIAASLVSADDPARHAKVLAKMAVNDRSKYALRLQLLRKHIAEGSALNAAAVSLNPFASAHHIEDEDLAGACRSGQWGNLRRWQLPM